MAVDCETPERQLAVHLLKIEGAKHLGIRDNLASLPQDLGRQHCTEVDRWSGMIRELARSAGVATPLNEPAVETMHAINKGKAESGQAALDEVSRDVDSMEGSRH